MPERKEPFKVKRAGIDPRKASYRLRLPTGGQTQTVAGSTMGTLGPNRVWKGVAEGKRGHTEPLSGSRQARDSPRHRIVPGCGFSPRSALASAVAPGPVLPPTARSAGESSRSSGPGRERTEGLRPGVRRCCDMNRGFGEFQWTRSGKDRTLVHWAVCRCAVSRVNAN
jgi:hypothetical protein